MPRKTLRCAACDEDFEPVLTDVEAEAQLTSEFPGAQVADCVIVCDPCYRQIMGSTAPSSRAVH